MTAKTTPMMLVIAAFLGSLACVLAVVLILAGPRGGVLGTSSAIGGPFRLLDQNGHTVTDADVRGEPHLVFFGFTHCPEVCPTTLLELTDVFDKLGPDAGRVRVMSVMSSNAVSSW